MTVPSVSAPCWRSSIRKIEHVERASIGQHLTRMAPHDLQSRFGGRVSAAFIANYADVAFDCGTTIFGCYQDDCLCGIAELRPMDAAGVRSEAAFTVEPVWQSMGIGTALMKMVIAEAFRNSVAEVIVCCTRDNRRMQRITETLGGLLSFDSGECTGVIQIDDMILHSFVTPAIQTHAISIRLPTKSGTTTLTP